MPAPSKSQEGLRVGVPYYGHEHFCNAKTLRFFFASCVRPEEPVVDTEFIEKYLTLFCLAMVEENWERLFELTRDAAREARLSQSKAGLSRAEAMDLPLTMTTLSARTLTYLQEAGIEYVHELLDKSDDDLLAIKQFGPRCVAECRKATTEVGFDTEGRYHGIGG